MPITLPIQIIPNWHAVIVHFPVALLVTATGLCVAAKLAGEKTIGDSFYKAARWNLWLGTMAAFIAVATGWYAYQTVAHDDAGHAAMTIHMRWAFLSLAVSSLTSLIALLSATTSKSRPSVVLLAFVLSSGAAVAVTGYLGGENVYRNGIGVMKLPEAEEDEPSQPETGEHHHHHHHDDMGKDE